jgi:hypothetical protein
MGGRIMATTINADTTNGLVLTPDTSGDINLQSAGVTKASITSAGLTVGGSNISPQPTFRNLIINGDMRIDQRNAGASVTSNGVTYTLDRWQAYSDVGSKYTVQQSTDAPAGFTNSLLATSSSAYTVGTNEVYGLFQYIEGFNTADLSFGTASASTVTLSFWVKSSLTGTFGGSLVNNGFTRAYPFTYTISVANTWEYKTVTVAGDTAGTWLTNNGVGIGLILGLGCGSGRSASAGSWTATYLVFSATGATSVVGTSGATFYITGVQLEVGEQASDFENLQYGTQLALCQRYFQKSWSQGSAVGSALSIDSQECVQQSWGSANTASVAGQSFLLPVVMRATPSLVTYDTALNIGKVTILYAGANGDVNIAYNQIALNDRGFRVRIYANSAYGMVFAYTLTAEL